MGVKDKEMYSECAAGGIITSAVTYQYTTHIHTHQYKHKNDKENVKNEKPILFRTLANKKTAFFSLVFS